MEIFLDVDRDSDNSYCENIKLSFYNGDDRVVIELDCPDRSLSVNKKEFLDMCKSFVAIND